MRRIFMLAVTMTAPVPWFGGEAAAANATDICFVETGMDDSSAKLRRQLADWAAEDPQGSIAVYTGTKVETAKDPVTIAWAVDWFVTQPLCSLIVVNTKPPRLPIFVIHADPVIDEPNQTALMVAGVLGFKNLVVYVYSAGPVAPDSMLKMKQDAQEVLRQYDFPGDDIRFEACTPHCRGLPIRTTW